MVSLSPFLIFNKGTLPMPDIVRYGIVGCGGIAHSYHLRELTAIPAARLVATADMDGERARATAERYGAEAWYADYTRLLARDDIDAVIVSTWHPTHAEIGIAGLEAGKHVLVQKPLTTRMADADRFVEAAQAARQRGQKVQCFPYNWSPKYEMAQRLIADGVLGKVCMGRSRMAHSGPNRASWFYDPARAEYGVSVDLGVYAVSMLTGLLGSAVSASGLVRGLEDGVQIDDNACILMEFASGAIGTAETSWTEAASQESTAVYGTEGTLYLDLAGTPLSVFLKKPVRGWVRPDVPPIPANATHQHFIDCILKNEQPKGTPEHARHVVEILLAAHTSSHTGQRVPLATRFS
jgi:predicted dehydrogenase